MPDIKDVNSRWNATLQVQSDDGVNKIQVSTDPLCFIRFLAFEICL